MNHKNSILFIIRKHLDDKKDSPELENTSPNEILEIFESIGGTYVMETFETNGWQCDWWVEGEYKGCRVILNGCMFYGTAEIYFDTVGDEE